MSYVNVFNMYFTALVWVWLASLDSHILFSIPCILADLVILDLPTVWARRKWFGSKQNYLD